MLGVLLVRNLNLLHVIQTQISLTNCVKMRAIKDEAIYIFGI